MVPVNQIISYEKNNTTAKYIQLFNDFLFFNLYYIVLKGHALPGDVVTKGIIAIHFVSIDKRFKIVIWLYEAGTLVRY